MYLYHWFMMHYHGWLKRREIKKMRKFLSPELDAYTDDQIVEGCRNYLEQQKKL